MTRDLGRLSGTLEKVTVFALILAKLECPENSLVSKLGYLGHEKPFSYVTLGTWEWYRAPSQMTGF